MKMRYDAKEEMWMPMEIRGVQGYFCDMRISRTSVPDCFHFWELADGDSDGIPCRYKPGIFVNFFGTFITMEDLPVDCPEWQEGFIGSDDEWRFTGEAYISFEELVRNELERKGHSG